MPTLEEMTVSRALFGLFPSYTDSPLPVRFDRIVQVGDSSGLQSPLSFGGFGSLLRHLHRTTTAIQDALDCDVVKKEELTAMQPYLPSLSTMWLFQKAMSVSVGKNVFDADIINKVLTSNFKTMDKLGNDVMMPFLQDVIQAPGLAATIGGMSVFDPLLVPPLLRWVGPTPVIIWTYHFVMLFAYSLLFQVTQIAGPLVKPLTEKKDSENFVRRRWLDALKYGSGNDY